MADRDVRLALFEDPNFQDRRILIQRGGIAVQDARALRFDNELDSFRLRNVVDPQEVTLLLFSERNFRGEMRVFRGSQNVRNLNSFSDRMSSFIVVGRRLNDNQINRIRTTRTPPPGVVIVRQ